MGMGGGLRGLRRSHERLGKGRSVGAYAPPTRGRFRVLRFGPAGPPAGHRAIGASAG
jgi:hypothetical protein